MTTQPPSLSELFTLIQVEGDQAKTFLQGQFTADINQVSANQAQPFCYCNLKGRVVVWGWLCYWQQHYMLCIPTPLLDLLQQTMAKYAMLSRVTLSVVDDLAIRGQHGQTAPTGQCIATSNALQLSLFEHSGLKLLLQQPNHEHHELAQPTTPWLTATEFNAAMIQAQIPCLQLEWTQQFTPQMLNAIELGMVSFTKGCYLGQEIVARTQHLGKRKRALFGFQCDTILDPMPQSILNAENQTVGQVIFAMHCNQQTLIQAVLNCTELATTLPVKIGSKLLKPLPLTYPIQA